MRNETTDVTIEDNAEGLSGSGALLWAVRPDHYEAVLDDWLEDTQLRGKQWTGVSDDSAPRRTAAPPDDSFADITLPFANIDI